jgi:2'-5' RNA ligase
LSLSSLVALDVAVLPPPDVSRRAIELSAGLPADASQGLCLGADRLPHITLTQQFVCAGDLDAALDRVADVLGRQGALRLTILGSGRGGNVVWLTIERTPGLLELHGRLMDALQPFERSGGTADAFFEGDARSRDLAWVAGYRRESSFAAFMPHITLGHATEPPVIESTTFEAVMVAACHLGRFCSCRRVLRSWTLRPDAP